MADVIIKPLKNGPYEIAGGAKLVDDSGKEYAESGSDPFYFVAAAHRKPSRFATAATKQSASKRKRPRSSKRRLTQHSSTPILQRKEGWSIGVAE